MDEFATLLRAYGAAVQDFPTIAIAPPADWVALDRAIQSLNRFDWIIFTSVNGVRYFFERLDAAGLDARALATTRLCAIGPRTAEELTDRHLKVDLVPAEYQAEGIVDAFVTIPIEGKRILLPRAEVARDLVPQQLEARGAEVTVAVAYRTVRPEADITALKKTLEERRIDVVAFTSSSTVRNYVQYFGNAEEARALTARAIVACIGPITAKTAEECGFSVGIVPRANTVPALADAIAEHFTPSSCKV
jgi:uroporphyrinogen III methyltransferase/synthase